MQNKVISCQVIYHVFTLFLYCCSSFVYVLLSLLTNHVALLWTWSILNITVENYAISLSSCGHSCKCLLTKAILLFTLPMPYSTWRLQYKSSLIIIPSYFVSCFQCAGALSHIMCTPLPLVI